MVLLGWNYSDIISISAAYHTCKLYHRGVEEGATPFLWLLHFTLDPYLIMLSVKQGGIKYHFWIFGMNRPVIESLMFRATGEHSTHKGMKYIETEAYIWFKFKISILCPVLAELSNINNKGICKRPVCFLEALTSSPWVTANIKKYIKSVSIHFEHLLFFTKKGFFASETPFILTWPKPKKNFLAYKIWFFLHKYRKSY